MKTDNKVPELRMGKGGWTPASLRDHYRYQIRQLDKPQREHVAWRVLSTMVKEDHWTRTQLRAVAVGLELGVNDG